MSTKQQTTLTNDKIKTWEKPVRELLLYLCNAQGIRYRMIDAEHILLYPPDGVSRPFKASQSRPAEMQTRYIRDQFMAVYEVPGPDGVVPGRVEEPVVEVVGPATPDPAEAVRVLAKSLGIQLDGGVDEEDYFAAIAEKDACQAEVERLRGMVESSDQEVDAMRETILALTSQRDELLASVNDAFEALESAPGRRS